jgi:hypothetical protein
VLQQSPQLADVDINGRAAKGSGHVGVPCEVNFVIVLQWRTMHTGRLRDSRMESDTKHFRR